MYWAVLSGFSWVQLCATLWTVARQAPLSVGFSRQQYWSGLPCPAPRDLLDPGVKPGSPMSPTLAGGLFTTSTTWEALTENRYLIQIRRRKRVWKGRMMMYSSRNKERAFM